MIVDISNHLLTIVLYYFSLTPSVVSYDGTLRAQSSVPFRGFSGNMRQKTALEKLLENSDEFNNRSRHPGTDINDDDHLMRAFSKKKGNVTQADATNAVKITFYF